MSPGAQFSCIGQHRVRSSKERPAWRAQLPRANEGARDRSCTYPGKYGNTGEGAAPASEPITYKHCSVLALCPETDRRGCHLGSHATLAPCRHSTASTTAARLPIKHLPHSFVPLLFIHEYFTMMTGGYRNDSWQPVDVTRGLVCCMRRNYYFLPNQLEETIFFRCLASPRVFTQAGPFHLRTTWQVVDLAISVFKHARVPS